MKMKLRQLWHIRRMLTKSIRRDGPMLIVAKAKHNNLIAAEGIPLEIAEMLARAVKEDENLLKIMKRAISISEGKEKNSVSEFIDDILSGGLDKFLKGHMDCENCEAKDTCSIIDEVEQLKKSHNLIPGASKN